jgi:hypothetical protein
MSLLGQIIQGEASSLQGQQAVLNVIMNRAAVNFGGYGTTLLAQATAPSQFTAYPNNLPIATAQANSLADQADAGTLANIVPDSLNYANPTAPGIGPNSWVWGAQASGQGVNVGGDGNIFWANSKGGSPGYVDPTTGAPGGGAQTAAQFQAEYGTANAAQDAAQDAPSLDQSYLQPGQGVSMPGQNFNQPNLALDNVAPAGYAPGDTGGMGQYSQSLQTPSDSTYTPGSAPTGGPQGVGVNGTAYDANGNYVGYVSSADTYVPNNASTPAAPSAPSAPASVGGFTTPSQDMGPYDTAQNQAAGLDLNVPGAGTNPNAFDNPGAGTTGPDNVAPAGSTPGDTGGMAQASQAAGGDYPSGVAGGLGPNYYSGGSSAPDTSGGGSSSAPDPSAAAQAPTNQAPASGDILGFNDPSQTYTMPDAVNTPAVEASTAQGGNASGDQTVPQAIDKQASVESTAIASAATAQSKAITSAQTSADKSASSLAQQAIKSAQSIASGQQASSKEQTASNQAASQTMLSQVKDLFVRFFLGAGGLVLIAAAVWYFAGRPTPPMPVMRAVRT